MSADPHPADSTGVEGYHPTGVAAAAVVSGALVACQIQDRDLVLFRHNAAIIAFARRCPHAAGDLACGDVSRGRIICPEHGYKFDLATGRILWPADEIYRLRRYPVRQLDGQVYVRLEP